MPITARSKDDGEGNAGVQRRHAAADGVRSRIEPPFRVFELPITPSLHVEGSVPERLNVAGACTSAREWPGCPTLRPLTEREGARASPISSGSSRRVHDVAIESPLDEQATRAVSADLGNTVLLKREDLQEVFSVQAARRSHNRIAAPLPRRAGKRGLICASAGNMLRGSARCQQAGHSRDHRHARSSARRTSKSRR